MAKIHKVNWHQTDFWPEYTTEQRISLVQRDIEKAKKSLSGLFRRCNEIKNTVEFQEGILEDIAMENISLTSR
jgi:hypothetical protein